MLWCLNSHHLNIPAGLFKRLDVLITQEHDVIYKIQLNNAVNIPVHLFFLYTDASSEGEDETGVSRNVNTTASYNSTANITHIEFMSQVPFEEFRVSVALRTRAGQLGPLNEKTETFGKQRVISHDAQLTLICNANHCP